MFRSKTTVWTIAAVGIVMVGAVGVSSMRVRSDTILPGVTIAHKPVGGLTKQQAAARLRSWSLESVSHDLVISYQQKRWTAPLRDLGVRADVPSAVVQAYAAGREGGFISRLAAGLGLSSRDISIRFKADPRAIDPVLSKIANAVNVPHKDAKIRLEDDEFAIDRDFPGIKVDEEATRKAILAAAMTGQPSALVVAKTDAPDVTAEQLKSIDTVLASYTTRFPAHRKARTHNIRIAASRVNGTVIPPGGVFSYNDVVGPREKSTGFQDAPIFQNGMLVPGVGGGICQVSSTLYNAVLLANLKIMQRSHHSSEVPYVPNGRDATVAYGLLDFSFKNTTSSPVYIATAIKGSRLSVAVYGCSRDKADVAIQLVSNGRSKSGISSVSVFRTVLKDGKVVKREFLSRDVYKPVKADLTKPGAKKPPNKPKTAGKPV